MISLKGCQLLNSWLKQSVIKQMVVLISAKVKSCSVVTVFKICRNLKEEKFSHNFSKQQTVESHSNCRWVNKRWFCPSQPPRSDLKNNRHHRSCQHCSFIPSCWQSLRRLLFSSCNRAVNGDNIYCLTSSYITDIPPSSGRTIFLTTAVNLRLKSERKRAATTVPSPPADVHLNTATPSLSPLCY